MKKWIQKKKIINICFIVDLQVILDSDSDNEENKSIYDEMKQLMNLLAKAKIKLNKLDNENKGLKDEITVVKEDNEYLNKELNESMIKNEKFEKDNNNLREEVKELKTRINGLSQTLDSTFNKFNESDKKVQMLISSQRQDKSKSGL